METPSREQQHWNDRYDGAQVGLPSSHVVNALRHLPVAGRAIDVAGGSGATALAMAAHGLTVTLADISPVALELASNAATSRKLSIERVCVDFERERFPPGPWDVIVCTNYLNRDLIASMIDELATHGTLVLLIPTVTNLERNPRPSARFLLGNGEMETLTAALRTVYYCEDWFDGRHEARFVGQKS